MTGPLRDLHETERATREVARLVKSAVPPDVGFVLLLYTPGDGGFMTYISTGSREDTINMLKELTVKMELDGADSGCPSN